jgi:hypothetical protein
MLHYFLTGHEPSRQTAVGLAEYVIQIDDGRLSRFRWLSSAPTGGANATAPAFYGPARSSGNSLNALTDGHRLTGDARFLTKAEELVRRVIHPADDLVGGQLSDPEGHWFYTMFLQALGKYLHYRAERGLVDDHYAYGRASLLHYARWMREHEYPYLEKPEKLEHPTETWAAQDVRKSDVFYYAAIHAAGMERDAFLERAAFFHDHSVGSLRAMATRTFARPVIVMLTSGFMHGWLERHPDVHEPVPPASEDFGAPTEFIPQRRQAERRVKMIAAAGVAGALALLALYLL